MGIRCAWSLIVVMVMLVGFSTAKTSPTPAPAPAPAPGVDCSSAILTLADCLSYVQTGETTKKPEGTCCSSLKKVVKNEVTCLCEGFKQSGSLGISLNITKALELPDACGIKIPSFTNCNLTQVTGTAPALSPSQFFNAAPPLSSPSSTFPASPPQNGSAPTRFQFPYAMLMLSLLFIIGVGGTAIPF